MNNSDLIVSQIRQRLEILYQMVDELEAGGGGAPVDAYTKSQTDALLADKADKSTTYTKTQTDSEIGGAIAALDVSSTAATGHYIKSIEQVDGKINAVAELVDTTPTTGSTKLCTSGGIYDAIQAAAGGGGTDLTPVNVGSYQSTFPEDYMYVLQKHLPFVGASISATAGQAWFFLAEDINVYYYIQPLIYGSYIGGPIKYRKATINKTTRQWTQQNSSSDLEEIMTSKTLPDFAFLGHNQYLSSTQNLNTLPFSGIWFSNDSANIVNSPTTNPFLIVAEHTNFTNPTRGYRKQTLTDFTTNDVYYRTNNNGTWSSWYKITATVVS